MPLVNSSSFSAPFFLRNGHIQTLVPFLFRRIQHKPTFSEDVDTADGDFLTLDWHLARPKNNKLVVLTHGLEGSSRQHYILGLASLLLASGFDVLAWNFRSCGGRLNRLPRFYHSGDTSDLSFVVSQGVSKGYDDISLVGFSMGGNVTLKLLGERRANQAVKRAVALSVPCDLRSSAFALATARNKIYMSNFLISLKNKVRQKLRRFPDEFPRVDLGRVKSFVEFDEHFTAKLHGFEGAEDYWARASSKPLLSQIGVPTLLINAKDDPFLARESFPMDEAAGSAYFHLLCPEVGGHVGFCGAEPLSKHLWSELQVLSFLKANPQTLP